MKKEFNAIQDLIDGEIEDLAHFEFVDLEIIYANFDGNNNEKFKCWEATISELDKIKTLYFKSDKLGSIKIQVGEDYHRVHSKDNSIKYFWIALLT